MTYFLGLRGPLSFAEAERERGETQTAKRITESREERKGQKILLLKVKGRRARYEQTEGGGEIAKRIERRQGVSEILDGEEEEEEEGARSSCSLLRLSGSIPTYISDTKVHSL